MHVVHLLFSANMVQGIQGYFDGNKASKKDSRRLSLSSVGASTQWQVCLRLSVHMPDSQVEIFTSPDFLLI